VPLDPVGLAQASATPCVRSRPHGETDEDHRRESEKRDADLEQAALLAQTSRSP
jgi:hypothetical protein